MPTRDVIVIGSSSGGIEALTKLVSGLPADLPATLFVVQHLAAESINYLPTLLARHTTLTTNLAEDGKRFVKGQIYIAPADRHLIIDSNQMFLSQGPRENRARPAIDPLFRSAALSHGPRSIGVILSGYLDDGTAGLQAIKAAGGLGVVQDPEDALTPSMPQSALDYVQVDHSLPAPDLGPLLARLSAEPLATTGNGTPDDTMRESLKREVAILRQGSGEIGTANKLGELAPASCPDCGGPLWEMDGNFERFRCHTGHAFTARHLEEGLKEAEEKALWVALRVMEERVRMLRRLARQDGDRGHKRSHDTFLARAAESEEHVQQIRGLLASRPGTATLSFRQPAAHEEPQT